MNSYFKCPLIVHQRIQLLLVKSACAYFLSVSILYSAYCLQVVSSMWPGGRTQPAS